MLLTREAISLAISLIGLFSGMVIFIWKVSTEISTIQSSLRQSILEQKHSAELSKAVQDGLDQLLQVGLKGNTERIDHVGNRLRSEIAELRSRFNDLEEFTVKTTPFERRRQ